MQRNPVVLWIVILISVKIGVQNLELAIKTVSNFVSPTQNHSPPKP